LKYSNSHLSDTGYGEKFGGIWRGDFFTLEMHYRALEI
jgi:hypothetical protein